MSVGQCTPVCRVMHQARCDGAADAKLSNIGQPTHSSRFTRIFDRRATAAGLTRIRLHDLRHTWATLALQAGIHPKVVSERLGHSTIAITLDIYSHVTPTSNAKQPM